MIITLSGRVPGFFISILRDFNEIYFRGNVLQALTSDLLDIDVSLIIAPSFAALPLPKGKINIRMYSMVNRVSLRNQFRRLEDDSEFEFFDGEDFIKFNIININVERRDEHRQLCVLWLHKSYKRDLQHNNRVVRNDKFHGNQRHKRNRNKRKYKRNLSQDHLL